MNIKTLIASYLRESADNIENENCGLTESEMLELIKNIAHIKLNKTQSAEFLNISTRTFDRRINQGLLPQGIKDIGSTQLYWYKDELLKYDKSLGQ